MPDPSYGFHGKYAEIDLGRGDVRFRPLASEIVADYLGGRGLATRLFYDAVDPAVRSARPGQCRRHRRVASHRDERADGGPRPHGLQIAAHRASSGPRTRAGPGAPRSKPPGYDALRHQGPRGRARLHRHRAREDRSPARPPSLGDGHPRDDRCPRAAEPSPALEPKVLCIGPAGENLVRIAAVANDRNRVYGRCGPGAVWGSKNLKAIRVAGREKIRIHDKERYQSGYEQSLYLMRQAPGHQAPSARAGHGRARRAHQRHQHAPPPEFPGHRPRRGELLENVSGETIAKTILERAGGCFLCPIGCQRHTRLESRRTDRTRGGPRVRDRGHDGSGLRRLRPAPRSPGRTTAAMSSASTR